MKKTYIAPLSQTHEFECSGMLALSTTDNGGNSLGSGDFGSEGDFEICSQKKEYWDDTEW